jgi:Ca2+-binding RTX toxin-like protein
MRRYLPLSLLAVLAFGGLVSVSRAATGCTKFGTAGADIIAGTPGPDRICAEGGNDYVHGDGSGDVVLGMGDRDTLVAGGGRDVLKGGGDGDKLFSIDEHGGNDAIYGGPGIDNCFADKGDAVHGCEVVHRVSSSSAADATIAALEQSFLGLTVLGESFQNAAPIPGPPGPPGTGGPPFPDCPPPASTPPPCQ